MRLRPSSVPRFAEPQERDREPAVGGGSARTQIPASRTASRFGPYQPFSGLVGPFEIGTLSNKHGSPRGPRPCVAGLPVLAAEPGRPGQHLCPSAPKMGLAFSVTSSVAPSMPQMSFCATVGVAQRNSFVAQSSVYATPVFPGTPVITLRSSPARSRGLIQLVSRVGRDHRVDEQALEGMVHVPVVVQVVVPANLAGVGVERERRVMVEVLPVRASEHEFRCREDHRRPDIDDAPVPRRARRPRSRRPAPPARARVASATTRRQSHWRSRRAACWSTARYAGLTCPRVK